MSRLATIDKVLHLKERREEEIEREVRDLRDEVAVQELRLASLEEAYMDTVGTFHRKQGAGELAAHEMGVYYSYLYHLQKEMDAKKAEIARSLSALDAKQGALVEAHKETRVVESLKDRRAREHAKVESRLERKQMDSISTVARDGR